MCTVHTGCPTKFLLRPTTFLYVRMQQALLFLTHKNTGINTGIVQTPRLTTPSPAWARLHYTTLLSVTDLISPQCREPEMSEFRFIFTSVMILMGTLVTMARPGQVDSGRTAGGCTSTSTSTVAWPLLLLRGDKEVM